MAAFTVQRSGNWSNYTSTGPWYVTGTGLPSGGGGTNGVPGAGDTVIIGSAYTVTVDTNQTVGTASTNVYSYDLAITGTLTIASGVTLHAQCTIELLTGGTLNLGAGSILNIDGTANTKAYYLTSTGTSSTINAIGTSASPCQINSTGTTSTTAASTLSGSTTVVTGTFTYCNFTNFWINVGPYCCFTFTNCLWVNSSGTPINMGSSLSASAVLKLIRCQTTGSTSGYSAKISVASGLSGVTIGSRLIQNCSFDSMVYFAAGADGWEISGNSFTSSSIPLQVNSAGSWILCDSNLFVWKNQGTAANLVGPLTNCIMVSDEPSEGDQQGWIITNGFGPTITTGASSTTFTSGVPATLSITNLPCNLPAGATLNYAGVDLTLTSAASASASAVTLNVMSVAGGTVAASASCVVQCVMGCIYQAYTDTGDNAPFYTATGWAPTTDTAICVKNNLILPSIAPASIAAAYGGTSGTLFDMSGDGSSTLHTYVTIEHNTTNVQNNGNASDSFLGSVYLGDEDSNPQAGTIISLRSNCAWAATANASNWFLKLSPNVASNNVVVPSTCGYNGTYNAAASTSVASGATNSGWTTPGVAGYTTGSTYLFSTTPLAQTTDVSNTNPIFIDNTRDLSTAYSKSWGLGQTSSGNPQTDWLATLAYLQGTSGVVANASLVNSIRTGILAGFAPTASSYNKTYSGDLNSVTNIGAVQGSFFNGFPFLFDASMSSFQSLDF